MMTDDDVVVRLLLDGSFGQDDEFAERPSDREQAQTAKSIKGGPLDQHARIHRTIPFITSLN
jgi:hypothetical protein